MFKVMATLHYICIKTNSIDIQELLTRNNVQFYRMRLMNLGVTPILYKQDSDPVAFFTMNDVPGEIITLLTLLDCIKLYTTDKTDFVGTIPYIYVGGKDWEFLKRKVIIDQIK